MVPKFAQLNLVRIAAILIAVAAVGVFGQDKYRIHVWQQIADTCWDEKAKPANVITACTRMLTDRARIKEAIAYIYAHRSLAHHKNNDLSLAMNDIDKAIAIRADISDFWGFRARFSLVIDDHAQFEISAAEAIKQSKSPEEKVFFLTERAWANFERGQLVKSYADCDRVLAIDPTNKDAIYRRIKIRLAQRNYDHAIVLLEQATSILPTDSNLFAALGRLHLNHSKDLDRTIAAFSTVIALNAATNPTEQGSVMSLGIAAAHFRLGNPANGIPLVDDFAVAVSEYHALKKTTDTQQAINDLMVFVMKDRAYRSLDRPDLADAEFAKFQKDFSTDHRKDLRERLAENGSIPSDMSQIEFNTQFKNIITAVSPDFIPHLTKTLNLANVGDVLGSITNSARTKRN